MKNKILYNINMLTLAEIRAEQIYLYVPDRARKKKNKYGRAKSKSMCISDREETRNNHCCSFLPT